ncbi:MAG: rhodanese-like domain-containing protein, partial [Deltaproteobacteria bacterium]|nr:rhodanese-like domain-containing protein [Deltaproteobacteria bacterium]
PQETLADRLAEVPRGKDLVLICNSGARSYEAQVTLTEAGFERAFNLAGGILTAKKWGEPIIHEKD